MKIVLATANANKQAEIAEILDGYEIIPRPSNLGEIQETGDTYEKNALIKAKQVAIFTHLPAVADDSGIEVFALGALPGVNSAIYGGKEISDEKRVQKLLSELTDVDDRRAKFVCVGCVYFPDTFKALITRGEVLGTIAVSPSGDAGFGYDPIFIPDGYDKTYAQMSKEEKNRISHRRLAFQRLKMLLDRITSGEQTS